MSNTSTLQLPTFPQGRSRTQPKQKTEAIPPNLDRPARDGSVELPVFQSEHAHD